MDRVSSCNVFVVQLDTHLVMCLESWWSALYCMDCVSSCNVYVVQLDTQCSFVVDFIHNICQLYSVSDLTGPSSGEPFKAVWADWYVVIHELFEGFRPLRCCRKNCVFRTTLVRLHIHFSTHFPKKYINVTNFMKIRPGTAGLFHADRQTWHN
jgi:hypothetical protein